MRDIRASVEVRALIGADKLRELHGDAFARYECWRCGKAGRTAQPTSVIVLAHRAFRVVKLTHAGCADSQIIEAGAAAITAMASEVMPRHSPGDDPTGQGDPEVMSEATRVRQDLGACRCPCLSKPERC